jgi:alpha-tubulin suppressor-like RCC1 family protein
VTDRLTPVAVLGGLSFRQVSAGHGHTCGVTTTDRAFCWGWNGFGQLGDGTATQFRLTPVAVAGGLAFAQVDAGTYHTCGVTTAARHAYCWGYNLYGQLGDGTTAQRLTPVVVRGGRQFRQVSAAGFHTCGVTTTDRAFCWGWNRYGQLGDSTEVGSRLYPVPVAGGRRFRQVAAGGIDAASEHTCGVTTGGRAFCWGNGTRGQLGNGKAYLSFWPRRVAGMLSFERVTAGGFHTCGETTDNRAYCWGDNGYGPLGDGTDTQRLTPVAVVGGRYFTQLSAGGFHTCGRTPGDVAYCWGANTYGELGDGTTTNRLTPVPVAGSTE